MRSPWAQLSARFPNVGGEFSGALSSALVAIPQSVVVGMLAVAPLGPSYAYLGVLAGLYASIISSFITALPRSGTCQVSGPHSSLSIITASVIAGLMADPRLAGPAGPDFARILGLVFVCLFLAGLFQTLLGMLRFGNFVKYIPYPVVAGFMNGIALSVFLAQVHPLFGVPATVMWFDGANAWWDAFKPYGLLIGVLTLLFIRVSSQVVKFIPPVLAGLLLGTLMYYVARSLLGEPAVGITIGDIPSRLPGPEQLLRLLDISWNKTFIALAAELVPSALLIAVVSSIVSLMSSVSVASLTNTRPNNNTELLMQGLSNMANAAFGVAPSAGAGSRSIANFKAGGRTRASTMIHSILLLAAVTSLAVVPWAGYIPAVVMAALLVNTAFSAVDGWSREILQRLRGPVHSRQDMLTNLLVVGIVTTVMVVFNLTAAVAIGFLATMFLFIGKISRSIIRRTYDGEARHSLRVWDQESVACLHEHRRDIRVIELEGAVFFGTADLLAREAEELSKNARFVLLDFKHVNGIDSTGALILLQLATILKRQNKILILSHLTPAESTWHFLVDMGINKVLTEDLWFSDLDAALEWIEYRILDAAIPIRQTAQERPLASVSLAAGLDHAGFVVLARCLARRTFPQGVALFHEGDTDDCLYILTQGVVSIKLRIKNTDRARRLGTYGPGVMFGEMALLEGKPRSADAIAEEDSVVYSLSRESLQHLQDHHPVVAVALLLNISRELANRLRVTTAELRAAT